MAKSYYLENLYSCKSRRKLTENTENTSWTGRERESELSLWLATAFIVARRDATLHSIDLSKFSKSIFNSCNLHRYRMNWRLGASLLTTCNINFVFDIETIIPTRLWTAVLHNLEFALSDVSIQELEVHVKGTSTTLTQQKCLGSIRRN